MKHACLFFLFIIASLAAHAARYTGVVIDSASRRPVPFAAVIVRSAGSGVLTDEDGRFSITTTAPRPVIDISAIGYDHNSVALAKTPPDSLITVVLVPSGVKLDEIVIRPGKEHYSKKNNPALDLMRRLRARADLSDPALTHPHHSFDKYERITIALNNFHIEDNAEGTGGGWLTRQFPFLVNNIDTSSVTHKPILNLILREKAATVFSRRNPATRREIVYGRHSSGIDNIVDPASMQTFYEDVLREVDIYDNDINILQNRFVSPLSRIAPDFYKFYLTDTVSIAGDSCAVLTFVPHTPQSFGFVGRLYIPLADSTLTPRRISMTLPRDININYIDNLYINQDYTIAPDGRSRLKTTDDMVLEASFLPGSPSIYIRRNTAYTGHSFAQPADTTVFNLPAAQYIVKGADSVDPSFWTDRRSIAISRGENSVDSLNSQLRRNRFYYWGEKVIQTLVTGYIPTGRESRFDFGPMNTTVSANSIEGARFRIGGLTTANLSPRLFARGFIAWGTKDHRWKYSAELEYSFNDKNYHSREFPVHSLRLTSLYDVDMLGQHYLFTNPDNVFLSLKRKSDTQMTYHGVLRLDYTLELLNNFSLVASIKADRQIATPFIPFTFAGSGRSISHFTTTSLDITLRYAPGERFFQSKTHRYPVNLDAPVFQLSHRFAPRGVAGNRLTLNVTEFSAMKRFWFSAWGYTDVIVRAGHVWSRAFYPNLLIPNANLSYTIQPESFALMNPMEFINDSYASWDLTYWANGAIFNYIPLLNKLKLREVFAFRGIWGHLSSRNDPARNPELFAFPVDAHTTAMTDTPYMEASVGLDNIFRILRVDYVWRLNYRYLPDIDRSGLRIALHFTF